MNNMRIIELIIENEIDGIDAVSVVDYPAMESNFIALSKQHEVKLAEVDAERRVIMGAALIPDKQIYRKDGDDEYYIFFSKDTVRQASELFLKNGNQKESTLKHEVKLTGMTVVESWIIEDENLDKSRKYDLSLPVGTWMISVKVDNDDVWQKIKLGEVKGFSIEGSFADKLDLKKHEDLITKIIKELSDGK